MEDRHIQDLAFWITYLGDAGSEKKNLQSADLDRQGFTRIIRSKIK